MWWAWATVLVHVVRAVGFVRVCRGARKGGRRVRLRAAVEVCRGGHRRRPGLVRRAGRGSKGGGAWQWTAGGSEVVVGRSWGGAVDSRNALGSVGLLFDGA